MTGKLWKSDPAVAVDRTRDFRETERAGGTAAFSLVCNAITTRSPVAHGAKISGLIVLQDALYARCLFAEVGGGVGGETITT